MNRLKKFYTDHKKAINTIGVISGVALVSAALKIAYDNSVRGLEPVGGVLTIKDDVNYEDVCVLTLRNGQKKSVPFEYDTTWYIQENNNDY